MQERKVNSDKAPPRIQGMPGPGGGRRSMFDKKVRAKDTKATLTRLWSYLGKQKQAVVIALLLVVTSTLLGLLGPYFIALVIDEYISVGVNEGLVGLLVVMAAVYVTTALITYLQNYMLIGVSQHAVRDMRDDLFNKVMSYSLRFFDQTPNGEVMSRLTNDIETVNSTLSQSLAQFISSVLSLIGVTVIMFKLNWMMALIAMTTIPLIILVVKFIGKMTRKNYRGKQKNLGRINGLIEETLSGQKVVKVYGKEEEVIKEFKEINDELKTMSIHAEIFSGFMGPSMNMVNNIRFAVIAGVGGLLAVNGLVSIGIITAFINYSKRFGRPLAHLANIYNTIQSAIAGAERVFETMDHLPEIMDCENAIEMGAVEGKVEFNDVDFGYVDGVKVLKQADFTVNPGDMIAIVGPTGAGKTTIINLLTRFYDIDKGSIHIDGLNIQKVTKDSLRKSLGIVLQDTYLFSDTVMENVRYGRLDATDDEVKEAAKLAYADHFIKHLPEGYDTMLSQEGSNLSQGQRQLLAIARAILSDPAILILDEATSSVDTRTEVHIQKAMLRLMKGRTSFVIAHRLSTIKDATTIMVIDNGEIIESGNHDELLRGDGFYANLYNSQFRRLEPVI